MGFLDGMSRSLDAVDAHWRRKAKGRASLFAASLHWAGSTVRQVKGRRAISLWGVAKHTTSQARLIGVRGFVGCSGSRGPRGHQAAKSDRVWTQRLYGCPETSAHRVRRERRRSSNPDPTSISDRLSGSGMTLSDPFVTSASTPAKFVLPSWVPINSRS